MIAISNKQRYPDEIRDLEVWICWAFDNEGRKIPRAPWETGNCYPVSWGSDVDERPETDFAEARKWSNLRLSDLRAGGWDFPGGQEDTNLKLGMILPHDPPEPPIMQVDIDDVRDPETGELDPIAEEIIERLDAYTMLSVSGTGIHCYVRASLPGSMGKFIADLEPEEPERGQIELYDHGRFVAVTGEWVAGTATAVPERQSEIEALIDRFGSDELARETDHESASIDLSELRSESRESGKSPYFDEPIHYFAEPDHGSMTGEGHLGAHPGHGATSPGRDDRDSTNFAINAQKNVWHCFAHDSGGGSLTLVAVLEGFINCIDAAGSGNPLDQLSDVEYARLCLRARDDYGFSGQPPYRAVVGIARRHNLAMADQEEGILGSDCYKIARQIYENESERALRKI